MDELFPLSYTHNISDIHSGGFSREEEKNMGFEENQITQNIATLPELVTSHKKNFLKNIEKYIEIHLANNSSYTETEKNIFINKNTIVHSSTIFDTTNGPIIIEAGATILPFCFLVGPLRIDEHVTINPHSHIACSYIGTFSKVGGEVVNSVIECYSNKGHYGYIGDSYIGSWVNIGGGTSTSNLKNTYGTIKLHGVETGEQFLGSIICDYVKTAVNTSIYTGKVIGIGSHIYGTVTNDVPSFTNYLSKDNIILLPFEVALKTAERMALRRNITITEDIKKVLLYAYERTEGDRKDGNVREGKLEF